MSFTDADLDKLKAELSVLGARQKPPPDLCAKDIEELIARLEAAEDVVAQAYRCSSENIEYYMRWLKASGKSAGCE